METFQHKVVLTKLESNHQNLRTDVIDGEAYELPQVGHCFLMTAPPLDPAATIRYLRTTPVVTVEETPEGIIFTTRNSRYRLVKKAA